VAFNQSEKETAEMVKPIKLSVTLKGERKVVMFFEDVEQVAAFGDFLKELITSVREKTRAEQKKAR